MSCNKVPYDTKEAAIADAKYIRVQNNHYNKKARNQCKSGRKFRAYQCWFCCKWHLTTQKRRRRS